MRIILVFLIMLLISSAAHANTHMFPEKWQLSRTDAKHVQEAFSLLSKERYGSAESRVQNIQSQTIKRYIAWRKHVAGSRFSTAKDMIDFYQQYPNWPLRKAIQKNIEKNLNDLGSAKNIIRFYQKNNGTFTHPILPEAKLIFADALLSSPEGESTHHDIITALIREAWNVLRFSEKKAKQFRAKYSRFLGEESMVRRASELVWQDRYNEAEALLSLLSEDMAHLIKTRILLRADRYGIDGAVKNISPDLLNDEGLVYDRIKWREKHGITKNIEQILKVIPDKKHHPKEFWDLVKGYIIELRDSGEVKLAYQLASSHNFPTSQTAGYANGEWLSGWIALQYLYDIQTAYKHFNNIYKVAKTPITKGRAAYWAAESASRNHNPSIATYWHKIAKKYPSSFYGQLAFSLTNSELEIPEIDIPDIDFDNYKNNDLLQLSYIAYKFGRESQGFLFAESAFSNSDSLDDKIHALALIKSFGHHHHTIILANKAVKNDGPILLDYAYPTLDIFGQKTKNAFAKPEPALVHAITRQESRFLASAKSHVGALGLMQLMPATAKETAYKTGERYNKRKLTTTPSYNVKLGSYYLQSRLNYYKGSHILAIASYNAGASNVNKWIKKYGDPRKTAKLEDILMWIESIPFAETRNYVMRVMEQLFVYRFHLSEKNTGDIAHDLGAVL